MHDIDPEFERRRHRRQRPSHPCELVTEAQRHAGTMLEISRGGSYVRTEARLRPGQRVRVQFADREQLAVVVHARGVPRSLAFALQGGVGLRWVAADAHGARL